MIFCSQTIKPAFTTSHSIWILNILMHQRSLVPMTNPILFSRLVGVQTWFVCNSTQKRLKLFLESLLHHHYLHVIWTVKEVFHQFLVKPRLLFHLIITFRSVENCSSTFHITLMEFSSFVSFRILWGDCVLGEI